MKPAGYRDIQPDQIPVVTLDNGGQVKVIAGTLRADGKTIAGPIQGVSTDPLYFDVHLPPGTSFSHPVQGDYTVFLYPYEGGLQVGQPGTARMLRAQHAGALSSGARIEVAADAEGARFLMLAGRPLREPIAQYGPFVMNTVEEVEQAIVDYQSGKLTQP